MITEHEKKLMQELAIDIEVTMMFGSHHSKINQLHSAIYEKLILLLATGRIEKKEFDKLNELNNTRDLENMTMVNKILKTRYEVVVQQKGV